MKNLRNLLNENQDQKAKEYVINAWIGALAMIEDDLHDKFEARNDLTSKGVLPSAEYEYSQLLDISKRVATEIKAYLGTLKNKDLFTKQRS
jgi:hypothetical protein